MPYVRKLKWDHSGLRGDGSAKSPSTHEPTNNHQKKKKGWFNRCKIGQIINDVDHPRPTINLKVRDNSFTAILDSQSSTSFVNQRVARFLSAIQNKQSGSVRGAVNNVTYTVMGQTFLSANCSGMRIEIPVAVIKNLTADVMSGHDFLVKYEVILDYAAHEIFMGKDRQLRVAWKDGNVVNHSICRPTVPEEIQIEEVKLGPLESSDEEKLKQLLCSFPEVVVVL